MGSGLVFLYSTTKRGAFTPSAELKSTPLLPVGKIAQPKFPLGLLCQAFTLSVTSSDNVPVETEPVTYISRTGCFCSIGLNTII